MAKLAALLLLLIPLASPFGEASATATSTDGGLWLDVSVEVRGTPVAVVVRGVGSGGSELPPVALADQGDGTWVGIVQLPVIENVLLGFEAIPQSGPTTMSDFHTLTELGVDRAVLEIDRPESSYGEEDEDELVSPQGKRWGWLGLAAGAAALTLLAFWTIGSVRKRGEGEPANDQIDEPGSDVALSPEEADISD